MAAPRARIFFIVIMHLGLAACASGFQALYDYDRSHDFSDHTSWAWISDHPMTVGELASMPNPLLEPRLMSAIESNLQTKGFNKVEDPASADFIVSFTVGSREKISVDTYPTYYGGYGMPGRWGGAYYGMGYGMGYGTDTQVRQYTKGVLAVDIFDGAEKAPMWHGVAEKSISDSDRKNAEETIDAAVSAVMKGFPPESS